MIEGPGNHMMEPTFGTTLILLEGQNQKNAVGSLYTAHDPTASNLVGMR
jgi:hypothetical protein